MSSLPSNRQSGATDHTLRSHDDAVSLLGDLVKASRTPTGPKQGNQPKSGGGAGRSGAKQSGGKQGRQGGKGQAAGGKQQGGGSGGKPARSGGTTAGGAGRQRRLRQVKARNRELLALIPVAVLVTAGFTAVLIVNSNHVSNLSVIYGGYFLAVCVGRPPVHPRPAAVRRSVPLPAVRAARRGRAW